MREVKDDRGRILWVAGPAVVHTGGCPALVTLVEAGYVDVLFAGNALATRDIEAAMLGRLPAVDLSRAAEVDHGHEHHIRAINAIRKAGSMSRVASALPAKSTSTYPASTRVTRAGQPPAWTTAGPATHRMRPPSSLTSRIRAAIWRTSEAGA